MFRNILPNAALPLSLCHPCTLQLVANYSSLALGTYSFFARNTVGGWWPSISQTSWQRTRAMTCKELDRHIARFLQEAVKRDRKGPYPPNTDTGTG